jgi:hypothetical protein
VSPRPRPSRTALVAALSAGAAALALFACGAGDDGPDDVSSTPGTPAARGPTPSAPGPSDGCEDLGSLSGSALESWIDTTGPALLQGTNFGVSGRPTMTRARMLAVGDAATLVGKPAVLGAGVNASAETCTHCLFVAVGCALADDCQSATWFFPRAGTATFTAIASGQGEAFAGSFADVVLEQVTIDPATSATRPVPGGACLRVPSLAFSASASGEYAYDSDGNITFSGDGGSGGGKGGGGKHTK